jgi:hypothetical protein
LWTEAEAERLNPELKSLTASSRPTAVVTTADAQTDALAFLGHLLHLMPQADDGARPHTGEGLALLMAIFIELGSGLGLYVPRHDLPDRLSRLRKRE